MSSKLTIAEWNQLRAYASEREREGWYYGNREHFEKRHARIMRYIEAQFSPPTTPDARSMSNDKEEAK